MVKLCQIHRDIKRKKMFEKYKNKKKNIKKQILSKNITESKRLELMFKLGKIPRNSSITRINNRCNITGNTRSVLKKFKLNRITFRKMALEGLIPGVTKSSW